ncbi:hypothetical protein GCM10011366_01150 [Ornithinimicrobium tianjinense]|uniref:Nudix hydrolase domain-containing protein n=1 Tax=Ornithinimicrobium tianjinense TaxID=1195761 RepID=A0A917F255_9MICO|nr:hypothetical protein GCM10011366_01150 [Ornithinimicrobium tianjinense]
MPDQPYRDFPMPQIVAAQARSWLDTAEVDRVVAPPRPSATVMLLREVGGSGEGGGAGHAGSTGVEVFVLHRASTMPFAPGMVAFPGGGVDVRDADPGVPWAGPSPADWAARLGVAEDSARELVIAAAREVFEECGVLLAGPTPDQVVADLTDPSWDAERASLLDRTQSFGELLTRLGLVLRTDLMAVRAHWITPVCEPRRYDTWFFAARMPRGQVADDLSTEAVKVAWTTPERLLAAQADGDAVMLPPTQTMIEQLGRVEQLDGWLARDVPVHSVMPWPVERDGTLWMRSPVDVDGHGLPAGQG